MLLETRTRAASLRHAAPMYRLYQAQRRRINAVLRRKHAHAAMVKWPPVPLAFSTKLKIQPDAMCSSLKTAAEIQSVCGVGVHLIAGTW